VAGSAPHGPDTEEEYRNSPMPPVIEERKTIRFRLDDIALEDLKSPVRRNLKIEGCTDYVAQPLVFSTGQVDALSLVSDRPGGFDNADLRRLYQLHFAFARITEIHTLRDTAEYLLNAYVGRAAGRRILAGEIVRGTGQTIEAVIWYCDLRGFTGLSDRLPRDAVIALLNDYFGAMGGVVTEAGGEILKFMGDGMLAIFPVEDASVRAEIVAHAARASSAARHAIAALNLHRGEAGLHPVDFGLALHIGEVMFGNIGASDRLDFTIIGPAVNYAARLEKLCTVTGHPVVLSSAIAALFPASELVPLGRHALKGIEEPQAAFTLNMVAEGCG
jgi:adenylate cyclase